MRFRDRSDQGMPIRFSSLAIYNAEVARGLVHTPDYTAQMADLQAEYDQWVARRRPAWRHTPD